MGSVDAISSFHTTICKFDGTMIFLPNAWVMAGRIMNYTDTPSRRIEMSLKFKVSCDLDEVQVLSLRIMNDDDRVLDKPAGPSIFVMNADGMSVEITTYCWANNADWLAIRSDLWLKIMGAIKTEDRVSLSLPQQEVYLHENDK